MSTWYFICIITLLGIVLNTILVFLYGCTYQKVTKAQVNYMRRICILMIGFSIASIIVLCNNIALAMSPQWYSEKFLARTDLKIPIVSSIILIILFIVNEMARQKLDILAFLSYPVRFLRRERQFLQHCALVVCFKVLLQCNQNVWIERKDEETYRIAGKELQNIQFGYFDSECNYPMCLRSFALKWQNKTMEARDEASKFTN